MTLHANERCCGGLGHPLGALPTADEFQVATPADWIPGEPVIMPLPGSGGTAKERVDGADEDQRTCQDWFFCTKELSEREIDARLKVAALEPVAG